MFLEKLCKRFQLKPQHIVIIPGNHDLNWGLAEEAYWQKLVSVLRYTVTSTKLRRAYTAIRRQKNHLIFKEQIAKPPDRYCQWLTQLLQTSQNE